MACFHPKLCKIATPLRKWRWASGLADVGNARLPTFSSWAEAGLTSEIAMTAQSRRRQHIPTSKRRLYVEFRDSLRPNLQRGPDGAAQFVECQLIDQTLPHQRAAFAPNASSASDLLERGNRLVAPQQTRDRVRVRLWVGRGVANHAQSQLMRCFHDPNQPPPSGRLRGFESLLGSDQPRAIDHFGIDPALLRPSRQRGGGTLNLEPGQLAVHGRDVNANVALTQAELIQDHGAGDVQIRQMSLEQVANTAVARRVGTGSRGERYGCGGHHPEFRPKA